EDQGFESEILIFRALFPAAMRHWLRARSFWELESGKSLPALLKLALWASVLGWAQLAATLSRSELITVPAVVTELLKAASTLRRRLQLAQLLSPVAEPMSFLVMKWRLGLPLLRQTGWMPMSSMFQRSAWARSPRSRPLQIFLTAHSKAEPLPISFCHAFSWQLRDRQWPPNRDRR